MTEDKTMTHTPPSRFLVRRDDLHQTAWFEDADPSTVSLAPGQVLLAVDAFAMTANNITYAVFGDAMRYWDFFPAREGWGTVPVWGFATVARSEHPGVAVGERVYGYLPMWTHFVVQADRATPRSFDDASAHRADLPIFYNTYLRNSGDAGYDPTHEAEEMLLKPLFLTGFLIDDFLADHDFFGARSVVVSSASSKTSIGLAFNLARHGRDRVETVGLTSRANKAFVENLGCYHRVVTYEDIRTLEATPTVFVDMAGDGSVTMAVHSHFGASLVYSCAVGGTHWSNLAFGVEFPGPEPLLFFAPSQVEKRVADWGGEGFQQRTTDAWKAFLKKVGGWIVVERAKGREAVERVYLATLDGKADPGKGYILSF
jgi:hypothetical protein